MYHLFTKKKEKNKCRRENKGEIKRPKAKYCKCTHRAKAKAGEFRGENIKTDHL